MDSDLPPEPPFLPEGESQEEEHTDEGWVLQKALWVVLAVAVVVPLLWGPSMIALASVCQLFGIKAITEGSFVKLIPLPLDLAIAIGVASWGLRQGWHLRPAVLWGSGIGAACIIALIAAGVPAFDRVRYSEREKAVLSNVRALAAAADQYFLENRVTSAAYHQLVGPSNYIKAINLVDREHYPAHYTQGVTIIVTGIAGARTVTYAP